MGTSYFVGSRRSIREHSLQTGPGWKGGHGGFDIAAHAARKRYQMPRRRSSSPVRRSATSTTILGYSVQSHDGEAGTARPSSAVSFTRGHPRIIRRELNPRTRSAFPPHSEPLVFPHFSLSFSALPYRHSHCSSIQPTTRQSTAGKEVQRAGGVANGRPAARNGRDPLGDGWSEHGGAVRRDRTRSTDTAD